MMTLEELFSKLSYGELSNLDMAVDEAGTVRAEKQPRVLHFVNDALLKIYSKFPLLQVQTEISLTGSGYTHTEDETFLEVLSIINGWGESIPFTHSDTKLIPRITGKQIIFPEKMKGDVQLTTQHRHPTLTMPVNTEDWDQTIHLEESLHEALTAYVASKIYGGMLTPDSMQASSLYWNRYMAVMAEFEASGKNPSDGMPLQKFEQRGWI